MYLIINKTLDTYCVFDKSAKLLSNLSIEDFTNADWLEREYYMTILENLYQKFSTAYKYMKYLKFDDTPKSFGDFLIEGEKRGIKEIIDYVNIKEAFENYNVGYENPFENIIDENKSHSIFEELKLDTEHAIVNVIKKKQKSKEDNIEV